MKPLLFKLLFASVALVLMTALLVNTQAEQETINFAQAQEQQFYAGNQIESAQLTAFQNAMELARTDLKTANTEISELRSQLSALTAQHQTLETTVLSKISNIQHPVQQSSHQQVSEQDSSIGAEPDKAQINTVNDAALQADRLAKMDDTLYLQESDPVWEKHAAEQIVNNLSAAGYEDAQLEGVVCRGVLCRIEINQDHEMAVDELFDGEQELIPWSHKGRVESIESESGSPITVMYITRENRDFPNNF